MALTTVSALLLMVLLLFLTLWLFRHCYFCRPLLCLTFCGNDVVVMAAAAPRHHEWLRLLTADDARIC